MELKTKLPIRQLVEFIMRSGDLGGEFVEKDRILEGARIHRMLQKKNAEKCSDYQSETSLSGEVYFDGILYSIEGRADGIYTENGGTIIDEIKTTVVPLEEITEEYNPAHWAQAKCYGAIYGEQKGHLTISVQLTYYGIDTGEQKNFVREYEVRELQEFLQNLIRKYSAWAKFKTDWELERDASILSLSFPFPEFRKGQRTLAGAAYRTFIEKRKLFAQAPTGTGKTISSVFPAVKAMGEGKASKIFYLTAKTITRQVAEEAFGLLRPGGLKMKTLVLTAKKKICFLETTLCNAESCVYAKGYFDRVNDVVFEIISNNDHINRELIEDYAKKHKVCPFELSLDVSLWVDCIICDYNYVFDPRVNLKRFFAEGGGDYIFLVDEAHNLVDRAREMFSCELFKSKFVQLKKAHKGESKALDRVLNKMNKEFIKYRENCKEDGFSISSEAPDDIAALLLKYVSVCDNMLKEKKELSGDEEFLSLYFEALFFLLIMDFFDERYITFTNISSGDVQIKLFCLDPSYLLNEALKRGSSAVLFSATLTPLPYFREILGGAEPDGTLSLSSPFEQKNLCLMAADNISTKYKNREKSIGKITELIASFVRRKTGNYIVYFPSYKYMDDVFGEFSNKYPQIFAVEQDSALTEEMKEEFLSAFEESPQKTLVAFCVLGGVFSEGIDLKGEKLIGTVIVSVGLPQLSVQQNIIRDYFEKKSGNGFEFAYMYPGMNKVLQAAGRVIRSEADRGAVLLIDERFNQEDYKALFPSHWRHCRLVRDAKSIENILDGFWGENK